MNATFHEDYRTLLKSELLRRQSAKPHYSLRAFARSLGVNPSFLSAVLHGKRNLSLEKLAAVAQKLGLSSDEIMGLLPRQFLDLDDSQPRTETLALDRFRVIADWYHFALLELAQTLGFDPKPAAIAKRLGITATEASQAVERLLRLGLLRQAGTRLLRTKSFIITPSNTPNSALRLFHAQHLERAKLALETQTVDERDITGVTIPLDPEFIPQIKDEIQRFRRRLSRMALRSKGKEVYHLSISLFRLTQKLPKENP